MSFDLATKDIYQPSWLRQRWANALLKSVSALTYREYAYRASVLKRALQFSRNHVRTSDLAVKP